MNRHVLAVATLAIGLLCPRLAVACACVAFPAFDEVAGCAPSQGGKYTVSGSVIDQTEAFVPTAQRVLTEI